MDNRYLKSKYEWTKTLARVRLGMKQLICRPYYNVVLAALVMGGVKLWKYKGQVISMLPIPVSFFSLFSQVFSMLLILMLILCLLAFFRQLGEKKSRNDESCLIIAFTRIDLRNGVPVLLSKKRVKGTDVVIRTFYSHIPMSRWKERKEELEDAFNGRFVSPFIEYGGKRKNDSKKIVVYMTPGRKSVDREIMYDGEL